MVKASTQVSSLNFYKTKKSSCLEIRTKTLFILQVYFRRKVSTKFDLELILNDHEHFGRRAAFTAKDSYLQSGVEETENPTKGKIICILFLQQLIEVWVQLKSRYTLRQLPLIVLLRLENL